MDDDYVKIVLIQNPESVLQNGGSWETDRCPAAGPSKLACNGLTTYLLNFLLARHDHINFLYKQLLHNYKIGGERSHFRLWTHQDHEFIERFHQEGITPTLFGMVNYKECGACTLWKVSHKTSEISEIKPCFSFCFIWVFHRNFAKERGFKKKKF